MPELPEVETTLKGVLPYLLNKSVQSIDVHNASLRWPVSKELPKAIKGQTVNRLVRRAKYIIVEFDAGSLLIHLGMSGSLRISQSDVLSNQESLRKHDHVVLHMDSDAGENVVQIRYYDPRRFGAWVWTTQDWREHKLIAHLGPEPLLDDFNAQYLFKKSRHSKTNIKTFIMNAKNVVGVGNIYANEALFISGIKPLAVAGSVSRQRLERLVRAIKDVLARAIDMGGTTLRDFVNADNNPGYFQQTLLVYGREGELCTVCKLPLKSVRISNRATVYCGGCQR